MTTYGFSTEKGIKCAEGYKTAVQASATIGASQISTNPILADCRQADWFVIAVNVSAVSGTLPTVTCKLQYYDNVTTSWKDIDGATMTAITAIGVYTWLIKNPKKYSLIKVYQTIGGTATPTLTYLISCQSIGMMVGVGA